MENRQRRFSKHSIALTVTLLLALVFIAVQLFNQTFRSPTVAAWSDCGSPQAIKGEGCLFVTLSVEGRTERIDACPSNSVYGAKPLDGCPPKKQIKLVPVKDVRVSVSSGASSVRLIQYAGTIESGVKLTDRENEIGLDQLPDDAMTRGSRFFSFEAPQARPGVRYAEFELRNGDYRIATVPFTYSYGASQQSAK